MILVTGATGHTRARRWCERCSSTVEQVRAFVRDPDKAAAPVRRRGRAGGRATSRTRSRSAPRWTASSRSSSRAPTIRAGSSGRRARSTRAAAGVRRIVKLSSIVAEPGAPVAFWDWHGRIEQHLRAIRRPPPWSCDRASTCRTCSRPPSRWRATAGCTRPRATARIAMIDPRDVGAAAAAVLTTAGHDGRTYVLTGPEAITYDAGGGRALGGDRPRRSSSSTSPTRVRSTR